MASIRSWTFRVGSLGGVPLRVHGLTVILVLGLLSLGAAREGRAGVCEAALLLVVAFSAVVGHEWAHAWTARRCGLPVVAVQIGPLFNAAFLRREPDRPLDEVAVAAAGPAFNALLAGFLALLSLLATEPSGELVLALWVNGAMAVGNLVPIFPLDGARILRGLLGLRWPWLVATRGALWVGNALLLAGAAAGFLWLRGHPAWLALVLVAAYALFRIGRHRGRLARGREQELRVGVPSIGGWRPLKTSTPPTQKTPQPAKEGLSFRD